MKTEFTEIQENRDNLEKIYQIRDNIFSNIGTEYAYELIH